MRRDSRTAERTLNRLQVLWVRRPREEAEDAITGLTSSDLRNNIDLVKVIIYDIASYVEYLLFS